MAHMALCERHNIHFLGLIDHHGKTERFAI
jgi:hypothetical protein